MYMYYTFRSRPVGPERGRDICFHPRFPEGRETEARAVTDDVDEIELPRHVRPIGVARGTVAGPWAAASTGAIEAGACAGRGALQSSSRMAKLAQRPDMGSRPC
jgi:hypothetical protein